MALIENLSGKFADGGVFDLGKICEGNTGGRIDHLKSIAGQQHDPGFIGQTK
jgi:hypothetical protein